MRRSFIVTAIMVLFAVGMRGQNEIRDTLCYATQADEMKATYNTTYISIIIKNIDGTGENYYYRTGVSKKGTEPVSSTRLNREVHNVSVVEVDGNRIELSYNDGKERVVMIDYEIPDPENRYIKSYSGWRGEEIGLSLGRKGRSKWSLVSTGLGMGWLTPVSNPSNFSISMGHSMEWTWLSVLGVRWSIGPHSLTTGLGIYWRNYSLDNGLYLEKEDGKLISLPFQPGQRKGKSRLQTFSLELPLLYGLRFGKHRDFKVWAGPVVNFNTGGNIKTQYKDDDRSYSIKTHKIGQTPVTVDAFLSLNWEAIGLYARYSPINVMREKTSLDFKSFSTGIMFMF